MYQPNGAVQLPGDKASTQWELKDTQEEKTKPKTKPESTLVVLARWEGVQAPSCIMILSVFTL